VKERKQKPPWSDFAFLVIVVLAILVAWFVIRPVGMEIASVFQRLTNAFQTGR
jgi:hypothetical protein